MTTTPIVATTHSPHGVGGGDGGGDNDSAMRDRDSTDDGHKWKFFESIKIHTDKKHSIDNKSNQNQSEFITNPSLKLTICPNYSFSLCLCLRVEEIQLAEECDATHHIETAPMYKLHNDSAILDQHGSPKKKLKTMLSGYKQIDQLLHTIIDYILRDFIDSWFFSLTDNKEFSEFRTRNCIEDSVQNICNRIEGIAWVPLITTKLVDIVALHARYYRLANEEATQLFDESTRRSEQKADAQGSASPQRYPIVSNRGKMQQKHRRNKSDTDLSWYAINQRSVGNSKFYETDTKAQSPPERPKPCDHETMLIDAFFNQCDSFRNECLDEKSLEGSEVESISFSLLLNVHRFRLFDALHGNGAVFHVAGGGFRMRTVAHVSQYTVGECGVQTDN